MNAGQGVSKEQGAVGTGRGSGATPYAKAALYLATRLSLILLLVMAASHLFQRRRPDFESFLAGLLAASVANIPCDSALRDALSAIGTVEFDGSFYPFAFAAGLGSIDFAVLLHLLVTVAIGTFLWRKRALRIGAGDDEVTKLASKAATGKNLTTARASGGEAGQR